MADSKYPEKSSQGVSQFLGTSLGSLSGTALALFLSRPKGSNGQETIQLDDAAMNALLAIMALSQNIDNKLDLLSQILAALNNGGAAGGNAEENANDFASFQVLQSTPGKPVIFPAYAIPKGYKLAIVGLPTNQGVVYIAHNQQDLSISTTRVPIFAGMPVNLKINNANLVWLDADVAGDGVACLVEQRSG